MAGLLIIAHAPLASALAAVAGHVYPDSPVEGIDIAADTSLQLARELAAASVARIRDPEALILADVFGATPCNAAIQVADGVQVRVVTGVNVPMLWRALCYRRAPLADLVERAVDGGRHGAMPVSAPGPQNQSHKPDDHAEEHTHHQQ